jgi:hypothetical protein
LTIFLIMISITDREKSIQEERRGIFMDLAADVLFSLLARQKATNGEDEPKNKRRKTSTIDEEIIQHMPKREHVDSESLEEKSGNWLSLIHTMTHKHGTKMPVDLLQKLSRHLRDLFEIRPTSRLMDGRLRQITTIVHCNASMALKAISQALVMCDVPVDEFWDKELPEVLIKFISIEIKEQEVMRYVLSLMASISKYRGSPLPASLEQSLMSVPFFQDPRNVCNEALQLIIATSTATRKANITRKSNVSNSNETLQWLFAALKHNSSERAAVTLSKIDHSLFATAILSIVKTNQDAIDDKLELAAIRSTNRGDDRDAPIEKYLDHLSSIITPFQDTRATTKSEQDRDSYDADLLSAILQYTRSRCEEYINDPISDSKKKKKGAAQYIADRIQYIVLFCSFMMEMVVKWPQLKSIEQGDGIPELLCQLIRHVPRLFSEIGQDAMAWTLVIQPLSVMLQNIEAKNVLLPQCEDALVAIEQAISEMLRIVAGQVSKSAGDSIKSTGGLNDSDSDIIISNDDDFLDSQTSTSSTPPSATTISMEEKRQLISLSLSTLSILCKWLPSLSEIVSDTIANNVYKDAVSINLQFEACMCLASIDTSEARAKCIDLLPTKMADDRSFTQVLDILRELASNIRWKQYYNDNDKNVIDTSVMMLSNFKKMLEDKGGRLTEPVRVSFIGK